ncbi:MAG: GH3 auxin-responsive promoter family protein, partial [Muribaculaceae bacterium]|nr:GH3 auxin-responsive promoter family protein [Muribaculaceae bacterium]
LYARGRRRGRHQWLIEWSVPPRGIADFGDILDRELQKLNSDYAAKRSGNIFLDPPEIITLSAGSFDRWLMQHGNGKLGGQRKIPRLRNDRSIIDALL